jgi:hypothetical protein
MQVSSVCIICSSRLQVLQLLFQVISIMALPASIMACHEIPGHGSSRLDDQQKQQLLMDFKTRLWTDDHHLNPLEERAIPHVALQIQLRNNNLRGG